MREVKYDSSLSCFSHLSTHPALQLTLEAWATFAEGNLSVYMAWKGSSSAPPTKDHCGKLVFSIQTFHQQPWVQIPSVCCGQQELATKMTLPHSTKAVCPCSDVISSYIRSKMNGKRSPLMVPEVLKCLPPICLHFRGDPFPLTEKSLLPPFAW